MNLTSTFPVVAQFERINMGFYRVEGRAVELSLARNSDKLFAKLDGWNRGVRGELVKFLQSLHQESRTAAVAPPSGSLSKGGGAARPSERNSVKADPGGPRRSPTRKTYGIGQRPSPTKAPGSGGPAFSPVGRRSTATPATGSGSTPRKESGAGPMPTSTSFTTRVKEGAVVVCTAEPLLGEPMVLVRHIDQRSDVGANEADGPRVVARSLCSGHVAEVIAAHVASLDYRPAPAAALSLTTFEEVFFIGQPEERNEAKARSVFGHVELGELNARQLAACIAECWPPGLLTPLRGLAWTLRPFFVDWLKRRLRPRVFTQLVVVLPDEVLHRPVALEGAPSLQSLLLDLTERDLLIATLLATPSPYRSRLYAFAAETRTPLPLAFPEMRCPCPPPDSMDLTQSLLGGTAALEGRGISVHWDAFEALLARPSGPLLLSLGGAGCTQAGKSQLLQELLGLEAAGLEGPSEARGSAASEARPRSPAHSPGVDLLQSAAPLEWTADVHGCALGDPTWMALIATLAATASLIVLHLSADDFTVEEPPPPQVVAAVSSALARSAAGSRGSTRRPAERHSSSASPPPANAHPEQRHDLGPVRVSARPELLALLRMCADARFPGVGSQRTRVLVLLRDVRAGAGQLVSAVRTVLEATLGPILSELCSVARLDSLVGGRRQHALAGVRVQLQRDLAALSEAGSSTPLPCIETLRQIFRHFHERLTLVAEVRPVLAQELKANSPTGEALARLLDEAEAEAGAHLCGAVFPVSEAASQFARLKTREKALLEDSDGGDGPNDAQIAELSSQLRVVEQTRRALLMKPLTPLVRFFVEVVLGEEHLRHAKISEFGQCLAAWRAPRLGPLLERRRELLEDRLRLVQDRRAKSEAGMKAQQEELGLLAPKLADAEKALEQYNISLDLFWGELAAIYDLASELQGVGIRPPSDIPSPGLLKRLLAEWAWQLNCPVQLLYGSPLQCAGQFLVEVLKELGAQQHRDLFVISVIGIQSSAKSTLLNYLFGCGFATAAGRCTRGLYCSLMECHGRTLLLLDTEGLMSLEAEGGDVFDAQLALMAMACSHMVLINHKGELSRQLQDLLEVCLFAMQHLKVCRIQPKILFVLRDQHDRSHTVHGDALRLMRKHLAEASHHLSLHLDELISLDPGSVFLLPSAFASDLDHHTGREVRWSTELFSHEALRLRQKIFRDGAALAPARGDDDGTPEFSTLPDWCLHAMSVWRVLDRYGPNLLHYKTIQEIEQQRELEELVKQMSTKAVHGPEGLAGQSKALLADFSRRLSDGEPSEQVDTEFRSSLQALLDRFSKRAQAELDRSLNTRRSKLPEVKQQEAKRKLQTPLEYQGELTRYTWALCLTESVDRDQLRALKVHFKRTIEELWHAQSSQRISDEQMHKIFKGEWNTFEDKCRARFERTARSRKQLAEEVCLLFNHVLRQHRHADQGLRVLELIPAAALMAEEPISKWDDGKLASSFFEVRNPQRLAEYCAQPNARSGPSGRGLRRPEEQLERIAVPEFRKHLAPVLSFEVADNSTRMPSEEAMLYALQRLCEAVEAEEERYLAQLGVRFQGGRVAFLNAAHVCLRHNVLAALVKAEEQRAAHQWQSLQSHRKRTEEEFFAMVQRHASDAGRAKMLADLFFDALAREWLDETLVAVAADIRAHCLADMPDASGAAERAYQQAFVERNWEEVLEYALDVNAYLHKIFSNLFEDRKASIIRVQRPQLVAQLGALFDGLTGAAQRWGHREGGKRSKLSRLQATLRELAAESRAGAHPGGTSTAGGGRGQDRGAGNDSTVWPLLSSRFPVVADFPVEDPARFSNDLSLHLASLLGEAKVESLAASRLEAALQKQQAQVWALIRGCSGMCPCCGSKCDRVDAHTVHRCSHHLLPAFNGWRVAGSCEAALDTCKSAKNHEAPKRSDYSDHLYANLEEYLKAEHPEWLPFPREDRELLADSVLKAAWVNCRAPLLHRYDMVDSTPAEWIAAYEEPHRKLTVASIEQAEARLRPYGYTADVAPS